MTDELMALADRVEALAGPCRETDCAIFGEMTPLAPHYTASLDAAMTLVPEGMVWNAGNDTRCWAHVWRDKNLYNGVPWDSRASTPSLALTAAALRARASKEPEA